jgi:hypothetical protein
MVAIVRISMTTIITVAVVTTDTAIIIIIIVVDAIRKIEELYGLHGWIRSTPSQSVSAIVA